MNKYFILSEFCYLVEGNKETLMYDLNDKQIFSFDILNTNVIKCFENQTDINTIKEMYGKDIVDNIINELLENNLGNYSNIQYFKEKFRIGKSKIMEIENVRIMNACFVELPTTCYGECSFCNENKYNACETCTLPKYISPKIDKQFYFDLLDNITKLNFQRVVFHGGDPLTNWTEVLELIQYTRENTLNKISILVKTNGELITDKIIDDFVIYNINPVIVFNCTKNIESGLLNKTKKLEHLFNQMNSNNINYNANVVIDTKNEPKLSKIYELLDKYKFSSISTSIIFDENLSSETILKRKLNDRVLNSNFDKLKEYHPCLNGNIAITSDKKIIPCPAMYQDVLVDLTKENILDCFENEINVDLYWKLSLDKINTCHECKFRFSCTDCRALEKNISGDLYSKQLCEMISK